MQHSINALGTWTERERSNKNVRLRMCFCWHLLLARKWRRRPSSLSLFVFGTRVFKYKRTHREMTGDTDVTWTVIISSRVVDIKVRVTPFIPTSKDEEHLPPRLLLFRLNLFLFFFLFLHLYVLYMLITIRHASRVKFSIFFFSFLLVEEGELRWPLVCVCVSFKWGH